MKSAHPEFQGHHTNQAYYKLGIMFLKILGNHALDRQRILSAISEDRIA
jgi:hypothetical protein